MRKSFLIGITLGLMLLSGCSSCNTGNLEESKEKGLLDSSDAEIESENEQIQSEEKYTYVDILEDYKEVKGNTFDKEIVKEKPYVNEGIKNYSGKEEYSVYYQYVDLTKDENPELVISINKPGESGNVIDIYTMKDDMPARVIESNELIGSQELYWICADGRIKHVKYDGVNHEEITYYCFDTDSAVLTVDETYIYDAESEPAYIHKDANGNVEAIAEDKYLKVSKNEDVIYSNDWETIDKIVEVEEMKDTYNIESVDGDGDNKTIHGLYTHDLSSGHEKIIWETEFLKDGTCDIDFTYGWRTYSDDPSSYQEAQASLSLPYTIDWEEGIVYLDYSEYPYKNSLETEFEQCHISDINIIEE